MSRAAERLKVLVASKSHSNYGVREEKAYELLRAFRDVVAGLGVGLDRARDNSLILRLGGGTVMVGYADRQICFRPGDDVSQIQEAPLVFNGTSWVSLDVDPTVAPKPGEPLPLKTAMDVMIETFCEVYGKAVP